MRNFEPMLGPMQRLDMECYCRMPVAFCCPEQIAIQHWESLRIWTKADAAMEERIAMMADVFAMEIARAENAAALA